PDCLLKARAAMAAYKAAPAASPVAEPPSTAAIVRPCQWCGRGFDPGKNPGATLCSAACGVAQREATAAPVREPGGLTFAEALLANQEAPGSVECQDGD